jgi:hypothetical protein
VPTSLSCSSNRSLLSLALEQLRNLHVPAALLQQYHQQQPLQQGSGNSGALVASGVAAIASAAADCTREGDAGGRQQQQGPKAGGAAGMAAAIGAKTKEVFGALKGSKKERYSAGTTPRPDPQLVSMIERGKG